jgi:hypothetical protein
MGYISEIKILELERDTAAIEADLNTILIREVKAHEPAIEVDLD